MAEVVDDSEPGDEEEEFHLRLHKKEKSSMPLVTVAKPFYKLSV